MHNRSATVLVREYCEENLEFALLSLWGFMTAFFLDQDWINFIPKHP